MRQETTNEHISENKNAAEVREVAADLRGRLTQEEFTNLMKPVDFESCASFAFDWTAIMASVFAVNQFGTWLAPAALIVIGSRQRALSNLVHDASHGNLFRNRKVNDMVSNIFGAYPMFDSVEAYRKSHMDHHRYLGSLELDPDSKSHLRYGFNDQAPRRESAWRIYKDLFLNISAWRDSVIGGVFSLDTITQLKAALSITAALGLIAWLAGPAFATALVILWVLSRMTTYHAIRLFAEFLDHAGLEQGTVLSFTRNLPHRGLFAACFHPHEDTYHLIHHLLPKVPHYKLAEAHSVLVGNDRYVQAHHCDAYFKGTHSALSCLEGSCQRGAAQ